MPPTIMVTFGRASAAVAMPVVPHVAARARAIAAIGLFDIGRLSSIGFPRDPARLRSEAGDVVLRRRFGAPGQEPVLELGHQSLSSERKHTDHQHRAEYAAGIERVLRGGDDKPEPALCAQKFADDGPND